MTRRVKWVGPWKNHEFGDPSMLRDHMDPEWDECERFVVSEYLEKSGFLVNAPLDGYTMCYVCHESLYAGFVRTDGVFTWRTGLGHYVQEHSLRLPQSFIDHVNWIADSSDVGYGDSQWWEGDPYSDAGVELQRRLSTIPALGSWEINTDHGHDPSQPVCFDAVILGNWADEDHPAPLPQDHIDLGWDVHERDAVAVYLDQNGIFAGGALDGDSVCLLCGKHMYWGFDRYDGVYVWRTGLVHYVRDHNVRPPQPFIDRVHQIAREIGELETDIGWLENDPCSTRENSEQPL